MADVFTKEQRSNVMRQVKSVRNKSTELKLIAFLKQTTSRAGEGITRFLASPTSLFLILKRQSSLTAVFGTGTIAEILDRKITPTIGLKNGNEIQHATKQ